VEITLPFTPQANMTVSGINANTVAMATGYAGAGNGTLTVVKYDGTYPVTSGQSLYLSGVYEST
jgi:Flp pilus assembly secretin CpaC